MTAAAREQGFSTKYEFDLLPNTGHDFTEAMNSGQMGKTVFRHLFDDGELPVLCPDCSQAVSIASGSRRQLGPNP